MCVVVANLWRTDALQAAKVLRSIFPCVGRNMPVKQPTTEEVVKAFTNALPGDRNFDPHAYDKYLRGLMAKNWQPVGSCVEVLDAIGARLVRVQWEFNIDVTDSTSNSTLIKSISALKQILDGLVDGRRASFGEIKFKKTELGKNFTVQCHANGIIG